MARTKNRITCPKCGKSVRPKMIVFNRVTNNKICYNCNKKIGTNPWFEPKIKGAVNKKPKRNIYNLKWDEKQFLWIKEIKNSHDELKAKSKIIEIQSLIRTMGKKLRENELKVEPNLQDNLIKDLRKNGN